MSCSMQFERWLFGLQFLYFHTSRFECIISRLLYFYHFTRFSYPFQYCQSRLYSRSKACNAIYLVRIKSFLWFSHLRSFTNVTLLATTSMVLLSKIYFLPKGSFLGHRSTLALLYQILTDWQKIQSPLLAERPFLLVWYEPLMVQFVIRSRLLPQLADNLNFSRVIKHHSSLLFGKQIMIEIWFSYHVTDSPLFPFLFPFQSVLVVTNLKVPLDVYPVLLLSILIHLEVRFLHALPVLLGMFASMELWLVGTYTTWSQWH